MKVNSILAALLLLLAGLQTVSAQTAMKVWKDKSFVLFRVQQVDSVQFVVLVNDITLSQDAVELEKGSSVQLTATVSPEDADIKKVTWSSSIPGIASVDENGVVTAQGQGVCTIICSATDGSDVKAQCQVTVKDSGQVDPDEHEWVDLGLPSGTLWATCNIGANSPDEAGYYFAWGDTSPKAVYTWETFTESIKTKYEGSDTPSELAPEDDAATANWGSNWQMPSEEQCKELLDEEFTTIQKLQDEGCLITSNSNGKSIFLPITGYISDTHNGNPAKGYYWTRTKRGSDNGASLELDLNDRWTGVYSEEYFYGECVRPVRVKN